MARKKENTLSIVTPLESDSIRIVKNAGLLSRLVTVTSLRTLLNTPAQSFAGVVTFDNDVRIADGKSIGNITGPNINFDETNNFLGITGCDLGVGTNTPVSKINGEGTGEVGVVTDAGAKGATLRMSTTNIAVGSGGSVEFGGSTDTYFASIKGSLTDGANNTKGNLEFYSRALSANAFLTKYMELLSDGGFKLYNLKSGSTQAAAGAVANEEWYTSGHATLPDNVKMQGA